MEYYKNLDLSDIKYFCEVDKIEKTEQWKDVKGYDGLYKVSDLGRVKSFKNNKVKILSQKGQRPYIMLSLSINNIKTIMNVHIIVAMAFLAHTPCGRLLVINHIDLNKRNNIKSNLEITTTRINSNRAHIKSTSKYVGVCWEKESRKWVSRIVINKKRKTLGRFKTEIEASNAYQEALLAI